MFIFFSDLLSENNQDVPIYKGTYIRLVYADSLNGTWTMHDKEIMPLAQSGLAKEEKPALNLVELKKYLSWSELIAIAFILVQANKP